MRKYVAVIESFAVRDTQYCQSDNCDQISGDWVDMYDGEIFLGIFTGIEKEVLREAAEYANTSENNIRLIDVNSDA